MLNSGGSVESTKITYRVIFGLYQDDSLKFRSGAPIWTLSEKVGEEFGGRDWPAHRLTLAPANRGGRTPYRHLRQVFRLEPQMAEKFINSVCRALRTKMMFVDKKIQFLSLNLKKKTMINVLID